MTDWNAFAELARAAVAASMTPATAAWLELWPKTAAPRAVVPTSLPVLRWLPDAAAAAPAGPLAALAGRLKVLAGACAWRQSYQPEQVAAGFLERYGWCELIGLTGPLPSERLACGFLLLGPATLYPSHRHAAIELYLPLSGAADWQLGESPFARQAPGTVIVHRCEVAHAMRTGEAPLLALYLWRGAGLAQPARLGS